MKITFLALAAIVGGCSAINIKTSVKDKLSELASQESVYGVVTDENGDTWYKTTTTNFGSGGTPSAGSDSACGSKPLKHISNALKNGTAAWTDSDSVPWFGIAPAQSMYQEKVGKNDCSSCPVPGSANTAGSFTGVLHVGCGDCIEFSKTSGGTALFRGVVVDTCPEFENTDHCPKNGGYKTHKIGGKNVKYYNHLDVLYSGSDSSPASYLTSKIGSGPHGYVKKISCTKLGSQITSNAEKKDLCDNWGTSSSPSWGGCPGAVGCSAKNAKCAS